MNEVPRLLHVANGTCTTRLIERAGIGGAVSIWADPLHEGPVPGGIPDDALLEVRASFLANQSPAEADPLNDLWQWRGVIDEHEAYDELVLWYEHDLFDQLNLVQLLTHIRAHVPAVKPVSLICIGSFPGRPQFKGLGELTPEELTPLFAAREPVGEAHYAAAAAAWEAFRAPSPLALDALQRAGTTPPMPFLAPALRRLLEEYPAVGDGLSRTERRLLQLAALEPVALGTLFRYMHEDERFYYVTDRSLDDLARSLASASPRLLSFVHEGPAEQPLAAVVAATDAGRAVLDRRLDRVACGLDRWIGGVHLQPGGRLWRWDEAQGAVTRG